MNPNDTQSKKATGSDASDDGGHRLDGAQPADTPDDAPRDENGDPVFDVGQEATNTATGVDSTAAGPTLDIGWARYGVVDKRFDDDVITSGIGDELRAIFETKHTRTAVGTDKPNLTPFWSLVDVDGGVRIDTYAHGSQRTRDSADVDTGLWLSDEQARRLATAILKAVVTSGGDD